MRTSGNGRAHSLSLVAVHFALSDHTEGFARVTSSAQVQHLLSSPMEHRWGTRSVVCERGYLHSPNGSVSPMQIVSVSVSGCLVETEARLPLFVRVELKVAALRARLEGQIIRRTERGFGVEWSHFPDTGVLALLARAPPVRRFEGFRRTRPKAKRSG